MSIDRELLARQSEERPIRIGLLGAGNNGRAVALQLLTPPAGMRLVAIANRTLANAARAFRDAGVDDVVTVSGYRQLERAISEGRSAITDDPHLLAEADNIDVLVDVTGSVEFSAGVVLNAIAHGKHVVLVNAELDSTLGPLLKWRADQAGVVITNTDGDEPGVAMNLFRYLKTLGLRPVAAGNLKGMIDFYRTPDSQREFAAKYGQNPAIVTSFADGTKLAMECAILANATGFRVGQRGMYGPRCEHVNEMATRLPSEQLLDGGLVDYALGAAPHSGAFVMTYEDHPVKKSLMAYLKMGPGPFHVFYTPFHLPHVQLASSIARAVLQRDATVAPLGAPVCEVVAIAKRDLAAGEVLDGVGGFAAYGVIENADTARTQRLLPMGLAAGCRLKSAIPQDQPITYSAVELPAGRLCDQLRAEQDALFAPARKISESSVYPASAT